MMDMNAIVIFLNCSIFRLERLHSVYFNSFKKHVMGCTSSTLFSMFSLSHTWSKLYTQLKLLICGAEESALFDSPH